LVNSSWRLNVPLPTPVVVRPTDPACDTLTLTRVSRSAFAQVVVGGTVRLIAYTVLALVMLTGRRLRVHERDARRDVAEFPGVLADALARVIVNAVHAQTAVLRRQRKNERTVW